MFIADKLRANGPNRDDVQTWCDHLDLDDYVAFGGVARSAVRVDLT